MRDHNSLIPKIVLALKKEKLGRALSLCKKVLNVDPHHFDALNLMGLVYLQEDRFSMAVSVLEKAYQIDSMNPDLNSNLGLAHQGLGNYERSTELMESAVTREPSNFGFLQNLGNLYEAQSEWVDAVRVRERALAINSGSVNALMILGKSYRMVRKLDEACSMQERALAIDPGCVEAYVEKVLTLEMKEDFDGAVAVISKAIDRFPGNIELHQVHSTLLRDYGMNDQALKKNLEILQQFPDSLDVIFDLSDAGYFDSPEKIRSLEAKLLKIEQGTARDTIESRVDIERIRFTAYDGIDQCATAFDCLKRANKLKRNSYQYKTEAERENFNQIKHIFENYDFGAAEGLVDVTPVFIVGMPRSGTSLTEQIIASHSLIHGAGELLLLPRLLKSSKSNQYGLSQFANLANDELMKMASSYLQGIRSYSNSAKFITDKLPHNFLRIGAIHALFPRAKIIQCVREPVDNCFSCYKHFFLGKHYYAQDLEELGHYYQMYADLMKFWKELLPGVVYSLQYESLVEDFTSNVSDLLSHLGLEPDPATEKFYQTERVVRTASNSQVRSGLYSSAVGAWRKYENELEPLVRVLSSKGGSASAT